MRSTAKADKCVRIFFFLLRRRHEVTAAAGALMMATLETAALLAEWAVVAVCAAIAVAWLVKELLMGVCVIDKRLDGKVVIVTGERKADFGFLTRRSSRARSPRFLFSVRWQHRHRI